MFLREPVRSGPGLRGLGAGPARAGTERVECQSSGSVEVELLLWVLEGENLLWSASVKVERP